jgi:hypothetical protein
VACTTSMSMTSSRSSATWPWPTRRTTTLVVPTTSRSHRRCTRGRSRMRSSRTLGSAPHKDNR